MPNGEWDVLGPDFGLGLPISWFDTDSIIALLDDSLTSSSVIDRLVIGWDGEEEEVIAAIRKMLRARGYFMGLSYEGKITFARLRLASIVDVAAPTIVTPIPYTLKMEPSEGEGVDRITGRIGTTPWFDGVEYELNAIGDAEALQPPNSLRQGIFGDKSSYELDLSVLSPVRLEAAAFELAGLISFRSFGAPALYIRANDPASISHGDMLRVGDPQLGTSWFVDADGDLIEVSAEPKWFGQVTGFRRNLSDASIDLTMLLHNWHLNNFARLRAPNAVVASGPTGTTYTVDAGNFFDPSGADATGFTVDDYVEIFTEDGARRSGSSGAPDVQQITAITSTTIELDADWTVSAVAGDIIRLARLNTATGQPETGNPAKFAGFQAYTYLGDSSHTVSPSNDDAHIYGYEAI